MSTSRCSHSQPISAAVASDGNPISIALARNACSLSKVAVGVSLSDESSAIAANGFLIGSLPGLRRSATFHARRHVFMAWLTCRQRSGRFWRRRAERSGSCRAFATIGTVRGQDPIHANDGLLIERAMLVIINTVTHAGLGLRRTTAGLNANDASTQPQFTFPPRLSRMVPQAARAATLAFLSEAPKAKHIISRISFTRAAWSGYGYKPAARLTRLVSLLMTPSRHSSGSRVADERAQLSI
jgi:hypothetical protein